jgi:methylthioribose-1-phosphate isomerase
MSLPRAIEWVGDHFGFLRLLDQTRLPTELTYLDCRTVGDVWSAIRGLSVRGAPAIGVTAAYGVVLGVREDGPVAAAKRLSTSRPTAVNLFWALERMERVANALPPALPRDDMARCLLAEARAIEDEDRQTCRAIGAAGAHLVADGTGVLTHCNAGGLATAEYGTALAVLFTAAERRRRFRVFVDETRPLLQGARLTAWELHQAGIDATLICDSMAAQVMKEGRIQAVIVGADRIAANGDTANKIGTYGIAILAKHHGIAFYVAAPSTTFDLTLADGTAIPIEERDPREVTHGFGRQTAPDGIGVYNPAFDVTPAELITAIVTERGLVQPVHAAAIRETLGS